MKQKYYNTLDIQKKIALLRVDDILVKTCLL